MYNSYIYKTAKISVLFITQRRYFEVIKRRSYLFLLLYIGNISQLHVFKGKGYGPLYWLNYTDWSISELSNGEGFGPTIKQRRCFEVIKRRSYWFLLLYRGSISQLSNRVKIFSWPWSGPTENLHRLLTAITDNIFFRLNIPLHLFKIHWAFLSLLKPNLDYS